MSFHQPDRIADQRPIAGTALEIQVSVTRKAECIGNNLCTRGGDSSSAAPVQGPPWKVNHAIETLYADGDSTLAWIDYQQGKSVSIPDEVRALVTPS